MIIKNKFYDEVKKLKGIKVFKDASLKNDNNMRIDAICLCKIEIYSYQNLRKLFEIISNYKYPYLILGKGSNVLFLNKYYECVIIKLMPINSKYLNIVYAGDSLNFVNTKLISNGIASLNFLSGVPCSIGGAICMNAGAFNCEMKDIIEYVYYLDLKDLKIKVINNDACCFSYRNSIFKEEKCLILGAKIKLIHDKKEEILNKHHNYLQLRNNKLPLEFPNLGSIFKNPNNDHAGRIIDKLGLKGLGFKGAKVSDKHANVIVNFNNATGEDVLKLIEIIEDLVYIKYKTKLEREIIIFK